MKGVVYGVTRKWTIPYWLMNKGSRIRVELIDFRRFRVVTDDYEILFSEFAPFSFRVFDATKYPKLHRHVYRFAMDIQTHLFKNE